MIINKIVRKGMPLFVRQIFVKELDKTKCSFKFLSHNLSDDTIVNVKCLEDGTLDLRGKKGEYRIIVADNFTRLTKYFIDKLLAVGYKKGDSTMLDLEFIHKDSIYYKNYNTFNVFFATDNLSLVCIIDDNIGDSIGNQVAYIGESLTNPLSPEELYDLIYKMLYDIESYDLFFSTTKLSYQDLAMYITHNNGIQSCSI